MAKANLRSNAKSRCRLFGGDGGVSFLQFGEDRLWRQIGAFGYDDKTLRTHPIL